MPTKGNIVRTTTTTSYSAIAAYILLYLSLSRIKSVMQPGLRDEAMARREASLDVSSTRPSRS